MGAGWRLLDAEAGVAAFPRLTRERVARLFYRRILGSPKCGKRLLSPSHVIADIRSLCRVRTSTACGLAISVLGVGVDAECWLGVGDAPSGRGPPRRTPLRQVGALARPGRGSYAAPRRGAPRRGTGRWADLPRPQLECRPCSRERTQPSSIARVGNARRCVWFAPERADIGRIPCLVVDQTACLSGA